MHIYVRRGGPNYQKGLAKMRMLGEEIGIPIEVNISSCTTTIWMHFPFKITPEIVLFLSMLKLFPGDLIFSSKNQFNQKFML